VESIDNTGRRSPRQGAGRRFERASAALLASHGLTIVTQNYRCRAGEIDIIAREQEVLVFVEVRARGNLRYASAAASVDARKQRRLQATAAHFLLQFRGSPPACRFDVITWQRSGPEGRWQPQWIRRAFGGC